MNILEAFVICFIAYLIYKVIRPSGISKSMADQLKKDISSTFATIAKKHALQNKKTVESCHEDLRSGDSVRVDEAIKKIEAIFDTDIADADEVLAKYKYKDEKKSEANISNSTNQEVKD